MNDAVVVRAVRLRNTSRSPLPAFTTKRQVVASIGKLASGPASAVLLPVLAVVSLD
jgi:hypothetical protein